MKRIALLSCVKTKLNHRAPAGQLYTSALFTGSLRFARDLHPDAIYVLSAKYGLVWLDEVIEPYDLTLNKMRVAEARAWARRVLAQLAQVSDLKHDHFIILAGDRYRRDLVDQLASYEVPMEGLKFGQQRQFLASANRE